MAGEVATGNDLNPGAITGTGTTGIQGFIDGIINDPQKRLYAIIAGVVLLIVITVSMMTLSQKKDAGENEGKLVPLVQQLDQARAFEIVAKLKSINIDAKVNPSEKPGEYLVLVYEKAVENAYLTLARTNLLEDEDYGLFDQNDWAASDYDKRIKLSRAINGDLSRIISRMDGLKSAIVRVNVPEQELFSELQSPTTATIQVELSNDAEELSKTQVKSIVNVLRGYVPNLEKERISIVDTQGRNYSAYREDDETDTEGYIEEVEKINKLITKRIASYLDTVVGGKLYKVSVSASVSREKVEEQKTKYSEGAIGARQLDQETLKAGAAGGGAGPSGPSSNKDYNSQSVNETMLPSFEQRNTTYLPGRVTKVTVALAVDTSVPTMVSLSQLRESVAAIIGPEAVADDVKLTVIDLQARQGGNSGASKAKSGFTTMVTKFFHGGVWSVIMKILTILAIIIGLLMAAIIGLNFLGAASNRNINEELDPNLGNEFDQVLNDGDMASDEDYGEAAAIAQQEALLREMMMNDASGTAPMGKKEPTSYEAPAANNADAEKLQFDNLLNNFQSVASSKPDILAKKIQLWLDE